VFVEDENNAPLRYVNVMLFTLNETGEEEEEPHLEKVKGTPTVPPKSEKLPVKATLLKIRKNGNKF
jgi:hypothetical protein